MAESRRIVLRGYRKVFKFERRLFRLDRWRIPYPHGVPVRGIGYFVGAEIATVLLTRLPIFGVLINALPAWFAYLLLPAALAWGLVVGRIDGRVPHRVLLSLVRFHSAGREFAGLRRCSRLGSEVVPIDALTLACDEREPRIVRGRIRGPATVTFRYPALCRAEGAPPWIRDEMARRTRARRIRARQLVDRPAMLEGATLQVPSGRVAVVE
jgi:hypothetical protein